MAMDSPQGEVVRHIVLERGPRPKVATIRTTASQCGTTSGCIGCRKAITG